MYTNFRITVIVIIALPFLISSCTSATNETTYQLSGPVRLLDEPEFLTLAEDIITGGKYVEERPLTLVITNKQNDIALYKKPINLYPRANQTTSDKPPRLTCNGRELPLYESMAELITAESGWAYSGVQAAIPGTLLYPGQEFTHVVDNTSGIEPVTYILDQIVDNLDVIVLLNGKEIASSKTSIGKEIVIPPGVLPKGESELTLRTGKNSEKFSLRSYYLGAANYLYVKPGKPAEKNADCRISFNFLNKLQRTAIELIRSGETMLFDKDKYPLNSIIFKPLWSSSNGKMMATRRSIALIPGKKVAYSTTLPASAAHLDFSYGHEVADCPFPSSLAITIRDKSDKMNAKTKLFSLDAVAPMKWNDYRIDVSPMAGKEVVITFALNTPDGEEMLVPFVSIGEPMIVSRGSGSQKKKNVILISLDTLRGDRLSVNGWNRNTMPFVSSLAKEGYNFTNMHSTVSWTLSSHKTMLTGFHHFYMSYLAGIPTLKRPLPRVVPTIATYFKEAGYKTFGLCDGGYLSTQFGFERDFDVYYQTLNGSRFYFVKDGLERVYKFLNFNSAEEWLNENQGTGPFFMFLHTYGPHMPYATLGYEHFWEFEGEAERYNPDVLEPYKGLPDDPVEIEHVNRVYDRGLRRTDDDLKTFFKYLDEKGLLNNTVVIITSDHGENLGERTILANHGKLWETVTRVPLILFGAGIEKNKVSDERVDLKTIVPTALDLAGIPVPDYLPSGSLLSPDRERMQLLMTLFHNDKENLSLIRDNYKLILHQDDIFLFDLQQDPDEKSNLVDEGREYQSLTEELTHELVVRFAQVTPGWKLYIPNQGKERLRVRLSELKEDTAFSGQAFTFLKGIVKFSFNNPVFEVDGDPLLFCFELATDDQVKLILERWHAESSQWQQLDTNIIFNDSGETPANSLTLVTDDYPEINVHNLVASALQNKINLWFNSRLFTGGQEVSDAALSDSDIEDLKDLGYLQ